jgi:hypothetical protein
VAQRYKTFWTEKRNTSTIHFALIIAAAAAPVIQTVDSSPCFRHHLESRIAYSPPPPKDDVDCWLTLPSGELDCLSELRLPKGELAC